VFTDNIIDSSENVTIIDKKCEGFPNDSLFRFDMFLSIKDKLENYDYIFFLIQTCCFSN